MGFTHPSMFSSYLEELSRQTHLSSRYRPGGRTRGFRPAALRSEPSIFLQRYTRLAVIGTSSEPGRRQFPESQPGYCRWAGLDIQKTQIPSKAFPKNARWPAHRGCESTRGCSGRF